ASTSVATAIVRHMGRLNQRAPRPTRTPPTIANASECVAPRWPHGAPYGTRRRKPTTSMSGKRARADQNSSAAQAEAAPCLEPANRSAAPAAVRPPARGPRPAIYVRLKADTTVRVHLKVDTTASL